jgi:hypothetical protein
VRQQLKENREALQRFHSFIEHFMGVYNQVEQVVDILYEIHKDEVNKIIEEQIKEKGEKE